MSAPTPAPTSSSPASSNLDWAARFLGDDYTWKARKAPVLLVAVPPLFAALPWLQAAQPASLIPAGVGCLLLGFCGHLGRIRGGKLEPTLWASWGGKPTTRMLRHRDTPFDRTRLKLLHAKLATATSVPAPTPRAEEKDSEEADRIYETYETYLRNETRNREQFPLVREELVNYGYARNAWGLRPLGLTSALLSVAATLASAFWLWKTHSSSPWAGVVLALALDSWFLYFWAFVAREDWVKMVAEKYASRLLEAANKLPAQP